MSPHLIMSVLLAFCSCLVIAQSTVSPCYSSLAVTTIHATGSKYRQKDVYKNSKTAYQFICPTRNGVQEECVVLENCEFMMNLLRNSTRDPIIRILVRQAFCGFLQNTPMVCCPSEDCMTPEGAEGTCKSISSCPHVVTMLQARPLPESTIQCNSLDEHSVCCASSSPPPPTLPPLSTTLPPPTTAVPKVETGGTNIKRKCELTAFPPDPSSKCCGKSSGTGSRIFGGTAVAIDEYPWLTVIEYESNREIHLLCGGALISGRYVVTASHCVLGDILRFNKPVNVRLGEYDISKPGPNCVEVQGGGMDCTQGELVVPIEKMIPHPEYDPASKQKRHDIALIRLASVVPYTEFIRPICLPMTDFTEAPPPYTNLTATGWGVYNESRVQSNIKLAVTLPYVSLKDCQSMYGNQLWEGQMCAGGVAGKDSCIGDSGGPLMRATGKIIELVGIVSFGRSRCGLPNVAGVYSKVYMYLPWIRSQIEE